MNSDDVVAEVALALHLAGGCPLADHSAHVTDPDRRSAAVAVKTVVALLRTQAAEWESPDLMDAAAWLEGTL